MKVLLVLRSRNKGGKSIEGIFQQFLQEPQSDILFIPWEYDIAKSLFSNVRSMRRQSVDVWHITGDIYFMALGLWGKKTIVTIHDIGRYKELTGIKKWIFGLFWFRLPIRIADLVTVVSTYTKNEIQQLTRNSFDRKIKVVYNAVNSMYSGAPGAFNALRPRILQLGTAPNKNLETVINAIAGLDCVLVIIGKLNEQQLFSLRHAGIVFDSFQDISDIEVRHQYALSDIVVFPSLYEGFGMPVIEAQAMGRPLITSRLASLPEVAGSGAYYLENPLDATELRRAFMKIIQDEKYRNDLVQEGYNNVSRFSWPVIRDAYVKLYKNLESS